MKKSMSNLNVKKKISVKALLFGCAILCPALIFTNSTSAMYEKYDPADPLFSALAFSVRHITESTPPLHEFGDMPDSVLNENLKSLRNDEFDNSYNAFNNFYEGVRSARAKREDDLATNEARYRRGGIPYPTAKQKSEQIYEDYNTQEYNIKKDFIDGLRNTIVEYNKGVSNLLEEANNYNDYNYDGVYGSLCEYFDENC